MSYTAFIRNNETGEIRHRWMDLDWKDDEERSDLFWWTGGNFGCDCNREREFERAIGREAGPTKCGVHRFTVIKVVLTDGREIPIDEDPALDEMHTLS